MFLIIPCGTLALPSRPPWSEIKASVEAHMAWGAHWLEQEDDGTADALDLAAEDLKQALHFLTLERFRRHRAAGTAIGNTIAVPMLERA